MRAAVLALAVFGPMALVGAVSACGGTAAPPSATRLVEDGPRWEDVFDTTPELLADIFPTALRSDPVYGPLLRRAIDLVREQSRVVAETRALDAMEDAEEVIVGVRPDPGDPAGASGEVVVVVRGVRADVDPVTLVDAEGRPLWVPGPAGPVRELVRSDPPSTRNGARSAEPPVPASLFELPGRTWVIASGEARARARGVFARPLGRPALRLVPPPGPRPSPPPGPREGGALAIVRIDGPSLVARIRALQSLGGLGAVGRRLASVTLELGAGSTEPAELDAGSDRRREIRTGLSYADEDAAAFAEVTVREVFAAIARKKPDDLAWLAGATVDRPEPGKRVVVTAQLPPRLVGGLLHAGAASLGEPPPDGPARP